MTKGFPLITIRHKCLCQLNPALMLNEDQHGGVGRGIKTAMGDMEPSVQCSFQIKRTLRVGRIDAGPLCHLSE